MNIASVICNPGAGCSGSLTRKWDWADSSASLGNSRVRRASGYLLTAFSNATPHTFFQP